MTPLRARANAAPLPLGARVAGLDWTALAADLEAHGCAITGPLLSADDCAALAAGYELTNNFRSRVVMAGTASAAANTNTSPVRCPARSRRCARRSIRRSPPSRTTGTRR